MGLGRSAAIVLGSLTLGESDRVVTLFSREFGRIHGVAKGARRLRSRFGGALEPFTLGELVFFDTGRSDLLRIDHFDVTRTFARVREDLERLGRAAWMAECVRRLTGESDRHVGLWTLLVRGLDAMERAAEPAAVAVYFGVRCLEALGHQPRLDRCTGCGRRWPFLAVALAPEGLRCGACGGARGALPISPRAVAGLRRLGQLDWAEARAAHLGALEGELDRTLEWHIAGLIGQPTRAGAFLRAIGIGERGAGAAP